MRNYFLFFIFFISTQTVANTFPKGFELLPFNDKTKTKILSGNVYTKCTISDFKTTLPVEAKMQSMSYSMAALHPRTCKRALRKLSRYEDYDQLADFIKVSTYIPDTQIMTLRMQSSLLPLKMGMRIKVERIKKAGDYEFSAPTGFMRGLKGTIQARELGDKGCLFYVTANWQGPDTGLNRYILSLFTETAGKMGFEILRRKTRL